MQLLPISKQELRTSILTDWQMPTEYNTQLDEYYILHWEGSYFRSRNKEGSLYHGDTKYRVVFFKCNPTDVYNSQLVRISFRKPKPEYGLFPVALVNIKR